MSSSTPKFIRSPLNPRWLIPEGWERILGMQMDYRLGPFTLHLWQLQWNRHLAHADNTRSHAHEHHQLLYYQRGAGRLVASGKGYTVQEGSIFFVPAGCTHRFLSGRGEPAICLALDFAIAGSDYGQADGRGFPKDDEAAVLASLLHTQHARPFLLRLVDQAQVDACIQAIIDENDRRELGYASMIQAHLLRLISLCLRATQRADGFGEHFRHTAWRHRLIAERAQSLIVSEAFRGSPELTLSEAARACATSPNQLNRIVRNHTGHTFHQLLLRHRLDHAAALLAKGEANCTEAAYAAGFSDSNYFSRAFKKVFGHAPSELGRRR